MAAYKVAKALPGKGIWTCRREQNEYNAALIRPNSAQFVLCG